MDLRLHIGTHRTATRHLRTMLSSNRDLLVSNGVRVLSPDFAEKAFARAIKDLRAGGDPGAINARLMTQLTADKDWRRLVMIDPNISGSLLRPMGREYFYPRISITLQRIVNVLEGLPLRIYCGLRNPASFVPSSFAGQQQHNPDVSFADYISDTNLTGLRWSDYLHRVQLKDNSLPVTTWRHEDYPFIWRNIAQAITGIPNRELLVGRTTPINPGLSLRGALLMHDYLQNKPAQTRDGFERVHTAFVQKFPSTQGHQHPLHWPDELIQQLTDAYDDDWYYIERMEGVETLKRQIYP